jgi:predicted alpha/beta hydrolase family esterase
MDIIDETEHTLFAHANACIKQLNELSVLEARKDEYWAEDQNARFHIWAANLGVFAPGHASSDHRLGQHPEVVQVLTQLLKALEANLNHRKSLNICT